MRSAYQTGACLALAERGIKFAGVVANSGGAAPAVMPPEAMREWASRFDDPRFISWKRIVSGPVMDIDFLVDGIFATQPKGDPQPYFIAATRLPEGTLHWFSRESGEPLLDQLRATKTMPGISRHMVKVGGAYYADGCLTATTETFIAKAFAEGAKEVLVIDCSVYGGVSLSGRMLLRWWLRKAPAHVKTLVRHYCLRQTLPVQPKPNVHVCRAESLPTAHALMRSHSTSALSVSQGYNDIAKLNFT